MADVAYTDAVVNTPSLYCTRSGVRQKPFVKPKELSYRRQIRRRTSGHQWGSYRMPSVLTSSFTEGVDELVQSVWSDSVTATPLSALAYSRAYDKLLSKTGERASLLTALAERQSTYSMVLNRLNQLYKGAKSLRRGRFRDFLRTFGIAPKPRHANTRWSRPRDFSALWLEYWFGWAPTIGDIGNAVDVWQRPIDSKVKLRVGSGNRNYRRDGSLLRDTYNHWTSCVGKFVLQLRCKVEVTNPDLWVANQMGFLNPVRTAWEVTPFSWFADWFTNIGQVLGSFTDTIGVRISDIWCTRFAKAAEHQLKVSKNGLSGFDVKREVVLTRRMKLKTLPRPALTLRVPGVSWTRGLTLSSLLVTLFSPKPSRAASA